MNKRLELLYEMIPDDGLGVIDVGTDHGQIPIRLSGSGYSGKIIASDIAEGPLKAARAAAHSAGVENKIRFLLCNGLDLCPSKEISDILIAGMGGDMIVKILDEAEWCMDKRYRLILQPMTKPEVLRYWLVNNEYEIAGESVVEDSGTLYQIIEAVFGGRTKLTEAELFVGKRALVNDEDLYSRQLETVLSRFERALAGMSGREGEPRFGLYRCIRQQLLEMRDRT